MTKGLERWYGGHDLHFITCSCYQRRPELSCGERRDLFLRVLERAREKYRFVVAGYVVMPEHFHLLITEPEVGNPSVVMKVVKERFTKLLHHGGLRTGPIWAPAPRPSFQHIPSRILTETASASDRSCLDRAFLTYN